MADFSFFLPLPKKTKILLKEGERVNKGEKVATFQKLKKHPINLAEELGVNPQAVGSYLLVGLGNKISQGEPIAKVDKIFRKVTVQSPVTGQIFAFDGNTGLLTIESAQKSRDLLSPLSGAIKKISQEGIVIAIDTEKIVNAQKCHGNNAFGDLAYCDGNLLSFDHQYQGKIVLTNELSQALICKAQVIDSLALIGDDDIDHIENPEITIAKIESSQIEELKNFIGRQTIVDCQQKKIAVLKDEDKT